jgi:RNA polymerase sigma factor (TIGR02999 family)
MQRERAGHTLQTTALINEAYLRLVDWKNVHWQNRAHFFGVAAQLMRRILVDSARSRRYTKRGGKAVQVSLEPAGNQGKFTSTAFQCTSVTTCHSGPPTPNTPRRSNHR